jgi:hypothetical protein
MVSVALASNMAFKFNAILQNPVSRAGTGQGTTAGSSCTLCGNWVSLPFVTQFEGLRLFGSFCSNTDIQSVGQPGVCSGLGNNTVCDPTKIDAIATRSCTVPQTLAADPPYQPNAPIRVILKTTTSGDKSQILVGSDAPGRQVQIRNSITRSGTAQGSVTGTGCTLCGNWVQLPYHTTARRLFDICLESSNFASVGQGGEVCSGLGESTICNPNVTDAVQTRSCTVPQNLQANPLVIVGRPIRVILKTTTVGDALWSPAHF